jgi:hypothetical protein
MKKTIAALAIVPFLLGACDLASSDAAASGGGHHHKAATTGKTKAAKPPAPKYTAAQESAIRTAQDYLSVQGYSRAGLISQMTSKYADQYKLKDATFAVGHIKVDWNAQAVRTAKDYLSISGYSRAGLISQMTSKYADKYTVAQATYAANHVGL